MAIARSAARWLTWSFLGAGVAFAQPVTSSCSDPYWASTLRCAGGLVTVPQPTPAPPTVPADVEEFTRVDFHYAPGLRCTDGTRPILLPRCQPLYNCL